MIYFTKALLFFTVLILFPVLATILMEMYHLPKKETDYPKKDVQVVISQEGLMSLESAREAIEKGCIQACYAAWRGDDVNASFGPISSIGEGQEDPWESVFPGGSTDWQPLSPSAVGVDFPDLSSLISTVLSTRVTVLEKSGNDTQAVQKTVSCSYKKPDLLQFRYGITIDSSESQPEYISDPCAVVDFVSCDWSQS